MVVNRPQRPGPGEVLVEVHAAAVNPCHAVLSDGRSRQLTLRHADPRRRREGEAAAARAIGATPTRSATALSISHPRFCIPATTKERQ